MRWQSLGLICLGIGITIVLFGGSACTRVPELSPTLAVVENRATFTPTPFSFFEEATVTPAPVTEAPPVETPEATVAVPVAEVALPSTAYTVQPGDTLLGLAMQYGVPMAAIQLQNDLGASLVVQVGQTLEIPPAVGWEGASPFWRLHEVAAGETLVGIGARYGVTVADLQAVNGIDPADPIRVGQQLVIPVNALVVAEEPAPTATPAPPTAAPSPTPAPVTEAPAEPTAAPPTDVPVPPPAPNPLPANVAGWPADLLARINVVRAQHGLLPFTYNAMLAQAAQGHANDCMQRGWCSHTGSDGSYIKERLERVEYTGGGWAECWAQSQSPQGAVDMWMDEAPPNDPHRRTLLSTWLTEIGIGVGESHSGYYYFIADFGRP